MDEALELAKEGMQEALDHLRNNLARVRAGRANPAILDGVRVDSYGAMVPLNQVATVSVGDARLLVIKPYDRNSLQAIEKAINAAQLGLNPNSDGVVLRLPIPPLTEERRKGLVKQVKEKAEEAKVACRQARRDANDILKEAEKSKEISEDGLKKALDKVQELTDRFMKQVEEIVAKKEAEIMEV
ncbi:MAG TPA: ribosome recycling factor [Nannocystaceae bacterium]|nr:ribosome recycling factor [Nannocystaceae bacterium]